MLHKAGLYSRTPARSTPTEARFAAVTHLQIHICTYTLPIPFLRASSELLEPDPSSRMPARSAATEVRFIAASSRCIAFSRSSAAAKETVGMRREAQNRSTKKTKNVIKHTGKDIAESALAHKKLNRYQFYEERVRVFFV